MGYIHRQVVLRYLRVVKHFLNEAHRAGGDAGGVQAGQPFVIGSGAEHRFGIGHQLRAELGGFGGMLVIAGVKADVAQADDRQQLAAQGFVETAHHQHPVGGLVEAVVDVARRLEMLGLIDVQQFGVRNAGGAHRVQGGADLGMGFPVQVVNADKAHSQHHQAGSQQGGFQFLTAPVAAAFPREQRAAHGPRLGQPAGGIDQRAGDDVLRNAVGHLALAGGDARHCLDDDVVAGAVGVRPAMSESGTLAVDEGRVDGGQGFVVNAQPPGYVGAVVGEDDVGLPGEAAHDGGGFGAGQVQRYRAFAPVVGQKRAAFGGQHGLGVAPQVAPGRFHFDHIGAHIGQQHTGGGRGDHRGKLYHVDAVKGAGRRHRHRVIPQGRGSGWHCRRRRAGFRYRCCCH